MSGDQRQIDAAIEGAARVARECFGAGAVICDATVVAERARSVVLRCHLAPDRGAPQSIIAKLHTSDDARGFSDWASLAFLTTLDDAQQIAPRFYGGDPDLRLYIMEDLGSSRTVADVITTGDAVALREALRALAEPMARLASATAGSHLEGRYERLRGELPGGSETNRHEEAKRWRAAWPRVEAWFAALNCPLGGAIEASVDYVSDIYVEPGPFLAFSHGDPAPSNNHLCRGTARLLDFEYGAYRHALYDISGWYVLCPLPERWAAEMHESFRQHLAGAWYPLADEGGYRSGWATMCAYRALAMLSWLPLDILDADRPWVEDWTMRGALLTAATRLGRATAGIAELASLSEAGVQLARTASNRWPELGEGLPPWPNDIASSHTDAD